MPDLNNPFPARPLPTHPNDLLWPVCFSLQLLGRLFGSREDDFPLSECDVQGLQHLLQGLSDDIEAAAFSLDSKGLSEASRRRAA